MKTIVERLRALPPFGLLTLAVMLVLGGILIVNASRSFGAEMPKTEQAQLAALTALVTAGTEANRKLLSALADGRRELGPACTLCSGNVGRATERSYPTGQPAER